MAGRIALLIGTPKGAFIVEGDASRREWRLRGPLCEGWPIHDISVEPGTGALLAGGASPWAALIQAVPPTVAILVAWLVV